MSKPLVLIYGNADANAQMKHMALEIRARDKTMEVNLRSAELFTSEQVEAAASVFVIGDYPAIVEAYKGKAEVNEVTPQTAEKVRAHLEEQKAPKVSDDGEGGEGKPDKDGDSDNGAAAGGEQPPKTPAKGETKPKNGAAKPKKKAQE